MADLLDVNLWLAFSAEGHPHHKAAMEAWDDLTRPTFCRVTHLGWLRLLCNAQIMGKEVLEPEAAWEEYEKVLAGGVVHFLEEPSGIQAHLKALTVGARARRDFWTDAYLAAFAQSAGMRMVTFDAGFSRFKDLDLWVLNPGN